MAVRKILKWPSKLLKQKSQAVSKDENINQVIVDMADTMKSNFGLGIAAPQINVFKNIVTIAEKEISSIPKDPNYECIVLINPEVIVLDDTQVNSVESCLSIDGYMDTVKRNKKVSLNYLDSNFSENSVVLENRDSCIIQHETDHLVGKLFVDRLSQIRKSRFISKYRKAVSQIKNMVVDKEALSKKKSMKTRLENRKKRKKRNKK